MPLKGKWLDVLESSLQTYLLTSWLAGHSSCLYVTVSHLPPCSSHSGAGYQHILNLLCNFCLDGAITSVFSLPLRFPVGHRHPGVIRNRVTPMGAAARKEAVLAADTALSALTAKRGIQGQNTLGNCRYHRCAGTTLEQHRLTYLQKCFCNLHFLEFSRQRVKLHCRQ